MKYLIHSKKTFQLKKNEVMQICKLKNSFWKFGLRSNLDWFRNKIKSNDIHNLIFSNFKLIGYTVLRVNSLFKNKNKIKYFYFDSLIIDKKYRSNKFSSILMHLNNQIILKNKKISFLICQKQMVKFYKKFSWKLLNKKYFTIKDHKFSSCGMFFNNKFKTKTKYDIYLYR
jgi:predicted GNAT family N-acyltransferase